MRAYIEPKMETVPGKPAKAKGQVCRCGYEIEHPAIQPKLHFSPIKWILLCMGATPYPTWVEYQCTRCETTLKSTDDPKVLATF
ncbi:hypothetical protein BH09MYX1_BH09MYX1_50820 [soil metagenome]